ncbi:TATA-box binding protein associated factor 7 like [Rhinolophus ferrumequinum]|uniref:TATA-box binding protein associated factor 7 like n=1 Tax=Rhinolophus ferrumequinum TaxID=59479 RepID=A0A671DLC6_RHIFE|nr:TATA-box binding protein associated factor 7 like [Rhinolophus ferrumequinum]
MEYPEGRLFDLSERDSAPTTSTSEVVSFEEPQILVDCGTETADDPGTQTASNQGPRSPANQGAQDAARSPPGNLLEGKKMSKSQREPPTEPENQFILRLPREHASTVREMIRSGRAAMKDKLKIDLSSDKRHAIVEVEDVSLNAKLVDLPCVIGSLKTLDNKIFYKMADISQMLVCTTDGDLHSSPEEPVASADLKVMGKNKKARLKKYAWKHGITPPLKNVRKKRFRKTTKKPVDFKQMEEVSFTEYIDSPDVEKEVRRLLCSDTEAVSARWEVIIEGETKEIESQGFIPSFEISSGTSSYEQGHSSSEYGIFRERRSQSTSNSDDEEDDDDDDDDDKVDDYDYEDEEEDCHEENLQRELQAKLAEFDQYESKEGASSIVVEIQKQIHYFEKKLQQVRCKEQRQKDLIRKVENLTLKNHLHSVLEQLKLQEKQKDEQISYLQKKLKYFLEK